MRRLLALTTIGGMTLGLLVLSGPASASARGDWFMARAATALQRVQDADDGSGNAFQYGAALYAAGRIYGWTDARTNTFATELLAQRHPATTLTTQAGTTCNYGLDKAYDAFNDGTDNTINTTYAVTLAGHVGVQMLAAYTGGSTVVKKADVQCLVSALTLFPTVPTSKGVCVAYSADANDADTGCVHNVNAGVADFLAQANKAGFGATGMQARITNITLQEAVTYYPPLTAWSYIEGAGPTPQDPDHGSYSSESMMSLAFWIGREPTYQLMAHTAPAGASEDVRTQWAIAHLRLAGAMYGASMPGTTSRTTGGSLWCEMSDNWRTEYTDLLASVTGLAAAQFAQYAARAARGCAPV